VNVSLSAKKGARSYVRLCTLKNRILYLAKEFEKRFQHEGCEVLHYNPVMQSSTTCGEEIKDLIRSQREKAVKEERERCAEIVEKIASDPPLESNEQRRGYQDFADQALKAITHPTSSNGEK